MNIYISFVSISDRVVWKSFVCGAVLPCSLWITGPTSSQLLLHAQAYLAYPRGLLHDVCLCVPAAFIHRKHLTPQSRDFFILFFTKQALKFNLSKTNYLALLCLKQNKFYLPFFLLEWEYLLCLAIEMSLTLVEFI